MSRRSPGPKRSSHWLRSPARGSSASVHGYSPRFGRPATRWQRFRLFAALALLLVAFGIYGLLSYTVAQRRGEIGIRMALGARRGHILALVVRQGAALVVAGGVIGVFAAAASSRVLESLLYGVTTDDPLTFIAAPLVVAAVALAACWLPARRAARVDPMKTLRFE